MAVSLQFYSQRKKPLILTSLIVFSLGVFLLSRHQVALTVKLQLIHAIRAAGGGRWLPYIGYVPPCAGGGFLSGTWHRTTLNSTKDGATAVTWEQWRFENAAKCDLHELDVAATVQRSLANRTVYFLGDSHLRNVLNAVVDVLQPLQCASARPLALLINGTMESPGKQSCGGLRRPAGHMDGTVHLEAPFNLKLALLWTPWYPPWNVRESGPAPNACEATTTCAPDYCVGLMPAIDMYGDAVANYMRPQTQRGCTYAAKLLQELAAADPLALFVIGFPEKTLYNRWAEYYMMEEFPAFLEESFKDRLVFASHLKDEKVKAVAERLHAANVPTLYYGSPAVALKESFYQKEHVAGPLQWVAARSLLAQLAFLAERG